MVSYISFVEFVFLIAGERVRACGREERATSFCLCRKKWQKKEHTRGGLERQPPLDSPAVRCKFAFIRCRTASASTSAPPRLRSGANAVVIEKRGAPGSSRPTSITAGAPCGAETVAETLRLLPRIYAVSAGCFQRGARKHPSLARLFSILFCASRKVWARRSAQHSSIKNVFLYLLRLSEENNFKFSISFSRSSAP